MMKTKRLLLCFTLMLLVAAHCTAQDEVQKKNKQPQADKATARAVKNTSTQILKFFTDANLTPEQKVSVDGIVKKHIAKLLEARKAQDGLLNAEQKKKRTEAVTKAKADGITGNAVFKAGNEAMGLSADEMKKFDDGRKKVSGVTDQIKQEITALLTDEQKAAMPTPKAKGGKGKAGKRKKADDAPVDGGTTQAVSLKLPNMT